LEFIHSFRNDYNSKFPNFGSSEANDSLEKINEIKNKISSGIFDKFKIKKKKKKEEKKKKILSYIIFIYFMFFILF